MAEITLSFATLGEIPEIMSFIGEHWKKGHSLSRSRKLFEWQHLDPATGKVHFILGRSKVDGSLCGATGYISTSHFDPALESKKEIWPTTWFIRKDLKGQGIGRQVCEFMIDQLKPANFICIGVSALGVPGFEKLGFKMHKLTQFYIANQTYSSFKIALNPGFSTAASDPTKTLKAANPSTFILTEKQSPEKSTAYVLNRYTNHPFYQYRFLGVFKGSSQIAFLVLREVTQGHSKALRVVDFLGASSALEGLHGAWQQLLQESDFEYVDFYQRGVDSESLLKGGFIERSGSTIIPHYFEPFERKNVDVLGALLTHRDPPYRMFKGDSDQDRPSIV